MFFREEIIHDLNKIFNSNDRFFPYNKKILPFKNTNIFNINENDIADFKITKLFGFTNSKSKGFDSMTDFAYSLKTPDKYKEDNVIKFQTEQDFIDNIKHIEKRFRNKEYFRIYHQKWNDRYFLSNADGSHHFGAIYRQCIEQKREYKIKAKIIEYEIDKSNLGFLLSNFYFIVTNKKNDIILYTLVNEINHSICSITFYEWEDGEDYLLILNKQDQLSDILLNNIKNQNNSFIILNKILAED